MTRKGFAHLVLILLVAGAILIAGARWYHLQERNRIRGIVADVLQQKATSSVSKQDAMVDWQRYQKAGFDFKYPAGWYLKEGYYTTPAGVGGLVSVSISPREIEEGNEDIIVFGGRQVFCEFLSPQTLCKTVDGLPIHTISTNSAVLEVFKRLTQEETDDWQTYRNAEYGFEFRLPGGFSVVQPSCLTSKGGTQSSFCVVEDPNDAESFGSKGDYDFRYLAIEADTENTYAIKAKECWGGVIGSYVFPVESESLAVPGCLLGAEVLGREQMNIRFQIGKKSFFIFSNKYTDNKADIDKIVSSLRFFIVGDGQ